MENDKEAVIDQSIWICTRAELLDFFPDLSESNLKKRMNSSDCPAEEIQLGYNKYNLKAYTNWVINRFYAPQGKKQMDEEKLRYQKYRSDREEYDAKMQRAELLPRVDVQRGLTFIISSVKNKLLRWIKRLPPLLADKSAGEIGPILKKELYIILSDMAAGVEKLMPEEKE